MYVRPKLTVTYEVGTDQHLHPDSSVCVRMEEVAIGNCGFGCKIYADPRSNLTVLAHNSSYGCNRKGSF